MSIRMDIQGAAPDANDPAQRILDDWQAARALADRVVYKRDLAVVPFFHEIREIRRTSLAIYAHLIAAIYSNPEENVVTNNPIANLRTEPPQSLLENMRMLALKHDCKRLEVQVDLEELAPNGKMVLSVRHSILYLPGLGWTMKNDDRGQTWGEAKIIKNDDHS